MSILSFAGHMLDQPGRNPPRFPATLASAVTTALQQALAGFQAKAGVASAACGSDLIFHELLQAQGIPTTVVLPFPPEVFIQTSVNIHPDIHWQERFEKVLANAKEVIVLSEHHHTESGADYELASLAIDGLAKQKAKAINDKVQPLVVWDGYSGDGTGGTAWLVREWQAQGLNPAIINTRQLLGLELKTPTFHENQPKVASGWQVTHFLVIPVSENAWPSLGIAMLSNEKNKENEENKGNEKNENYRWQLHPEGMIAFSFSTQAIEKLADELRDKGLATNSFAHSAVLWHQDGQVAGLGIKEAFALAGSGGQSLVFKALAAG